MTGDTLFVFGLLLAAIFLFVSNRVRLDVTALLVIIAFSLSGILTLQEAVAGFSDPTVLLIAALFVVGEGLVRTGIAYSVGDWLMRVAGSSETRLLILLMMVVAGLGAFMSSTGVVAIFIPVVLNVARKLGVAPGRLMMPMAFAALISGMLTLIATPPNLVVNGELRREGLESFNFFSFTPIGLLVLVAGIGYVLLVGRRLLPTTEKTRTAQRGRRPLENIISDYALEGRGRRLALRPGSPLIGQTVAEASLRSRYGVNIIGIETQRRLKVVVKPALADTEFRPDDVLLVGVSDPQADITDFCDAERLAPRELAQSRISNLKQVRHTMGLAEVMLSPGSELIGRTLRTAAFRRRHGLNVVAIQRKGEPLSGSLVDEKLAFGDTLLVAGGWKQIRLLQTDPKDFLVLSLPMEIDEVAPAHSQAPYALLSVLGMILLMTFNLVPNLVAALLAGLAMGLFRCVTMESAYKSIDWQSVVLIAGMLPFAAALQKTGGIDLIVGVLMHGLGDAGPYAMMTGLFLLTAVIGLFVSNTATAVLMAPIAIGAAEQMGVAPYPFAMTVAIAASAAFMTPVSSPVNTLVLGPGNYRFGDFLKLGVPMVILVMALTLLAVPLRFPI